MNSSRDMTPSLSVSAASINSRTCTLKPERNYLPRTGTSHGASKMPTSARPCFNSSGVITPVTIPPSHDHTTHELVDHRCLHLGSSRSLPSPPPDHPGLGAPAARTPVSQSVLKDQPLLSTSSIAEAASSPEPVVYSFSRSWIWSFDSGSPARLISQQ